MGEQLFDLDNLLRVLMDCARDIEENYKDHLIQSRHYTTEYALLDSVRTEIKTADGGYVITLTLNDYWKYVENDTKPHFPPPDAILKWIQVKPVIPRPDANGRIPTQKQLAFLIGRKINQEGTTGTHDLAQTKDNILPWYRERISQALGHDMENYIRKLVRDTK